MQISNGPQAEYEAYLKEGKFMIQRSRSTGQFVFYPRTLAPTSGARDLEWVEASGLGTIYAITVNHTREGSYNIALVDLDEGPRMMTTIIGVEAAPIGAHVKAQIVPDGESAKVCFCLIEE